MERLPGPELAARKAFAYTLDRPDLQAGGAADVRLDAILNTRVIERERLAALREEVDDGRTAQRHAGRLDRSFELRHRTVEVDEDIHAVAG